MMLRWQQMYDGGRILALSGRIDVGAVFPAGDGKATWRLWLGGPTRIREGKARSILAAKSALLGAWNDLIAAADLAPTEAPQ